MAAGNKRPTCPAVTHNAGDGVISFREGSALPPQPRHILTGAPGSGKTTVLGHLGDGFVVVGEPARDILAEQRAMDGPGVPDRDPALFVALLLERSIEKHRAATAAPGPVVFDRGVPDCAAYAVVLDVDPSPSLDAARTHRYADEVLILPPWEEIYETDDERTMSFEDTIPFHDAIVDAYERSGYTLVEVPRVPAADRAAVVRDALTRR
jgi:predicted ATPase